MGQNRREFITAAGALGLGALLLPGAGRTEAGMGTNMIDEDARWAALEAPEGISQEQIKGIVFPSHFNLEVVKEQLALEPRLVQVRMLEFDEAPIEAASHVGNVEIADYLLGRGARFKIQCACMLGMLQAVEAFLDARPELVTQPGAHGLPLMGGGDWNDGMNRVGIQGKGESVWLGFFLHEVLRQFGALARLRQDSDFAEVCATEGARLRENLERHGWDGAWYRRAWFDDGTPLGSQNLSIDRAEHAGHARSDRCRRG